MAFQYYVDSDISEIASRLGGAVEMFAGRTILLSGGAGFLGRYYIALVEYLNDGRLSKPSRLIVCDNQITSPEFDPGLYRRDDVRFINQDIVQPLDLDERVDFVIHAAGIASPHYYRIYPLETIDVATIGTRNLLELARRHDAASFLFFSSSEIYGDPDSRHVPTAEEYRGNVASLGPRACYDESKRLGETITRVYYEFHGLPAKIVRPFNVYGPGMREHDNRVLPSFTSSALRGEPLEVYGSGRHTRSFCYVTDALVGFTSVLLNGRPGEAYNIGNPDPEISMLDLARRLARVMGKELDIRVMEYPESYPASDPHRRRPDVRKARLDLGYEPAVPLDDGLRRFVRWAAQNYGDVSVKNARYATVEEGHEGRPPAT